MTTTVTREQTTSLAGHDLGSTAYRRIDQQRINLFGRATDDKQWIHTDPNRAKDGPFGVPVAHGFLTLSLVIPLWEELFSIENSTSFVNYGLDKVRFISPVPVDAEITMLATIVDSIEVRGGVQLTADQTIQTRNGTKPAMVARGIYRYYF